MQVGKTYTIRDTDGKRITVVYQGMDKGDPSKWFLVKETDEFISLTEDEINNRARQKPQRT